MFASQPDHQAKPLQHYNRQNEIDQPGGNDPCDQVIHRQTDGCPRIANTGAMRTATARRRCGCSAGSFMRYKPLQQVCNLRRALLMRQMAKAA